MFKTMEKQAMVMRRSLRNKIEKSASVIFALSIFLPQISNAHPIYQGIRNRTGSYPGLSLEPRVGFLTTQENFLASSSRTTAEVNRIYIQNSLKYGINENWFVYGQLNLLSTAVSNSLSVNGNSFGFTDQYLGSSYRIISNPDGTSIVAQLDVSVPAYSNNSAKIAGIPYMGDGSTDFTGSAFAEIALGKSLTYFLEAGAGYTWRSNGYSMALPYSLLFKIEPAQGFLSFVGARGQLSLKTDRTTSAVGVVDSLRGAGGSFLVNAINPSWINLVGGLGYRLESGHSFGLDGGATLMGSNSPKAYFATISATFDFGAPKPTSDSGHTFKRSKLQYARANQFENYDLTAEVVSTQEQLHLLKIDHGSHSEIEKGQLFDIFNGEKRIARAKVTHVRGEESALTVIEYFTESWVEKGFKARRLLR